MSLFEQKLNRYKPQREVIYKNTFICCTNGSLIWRIVFINFNEIPSTLFYLPGIPEFLYGHFNLIIFSYLLPICRSAAGHGRGCSQMHQIRAILEMREVFPAQLKQPLFYNLCHARPCLISKIGHFGHRWFIWAESVCISAFIGTFWESNPPAKTTEGDSFGDDVVVAWLHRTATRLGCVHTKQTVVQHSRSNPIVIQVC